MFSKGASTLLICILISVVSITGCCPDIEHAPDEIYNALTRHELTTFIDSAGNHEQIFLAGEGMDRVYDDWNECAHSEGYAQFPWAKFEFLHSEKSLKYEQHDRRMFFPDYSTWYMSFGNWNETYTVQDFEYTACRFYSRLDSTGQIYSFIIDKEYGLVMFSYRDEYRWERVREW